jgi:hypothetical protein
MNNGIQLIDVTDPTFSRGAYAAGGVQTVDLQQGLVTLRDPGGRLVQMDLGQADVHADRTLASYAAGFRLQEGCADFASPPVLVPNASDKYWTWDKDDTFQLVQDMATAAGGVVKEVSMRLSNTAFQTRQFALKAFVPTEVQANADAPLNPQLAAMRRIMNAMMLAREVRVATLLRTAANHTNTITATATTKWNGGTSSDPVQDLFTLIEASLQPITDIIMSEQAAHAFMQNAAVQKYLAYKQAVPGIARISSDGRGPETQMEAFSALLGLPPIRVAAMKYKSGASAYSYVWGGDVVLLHRPPAGVPRDGQDIAASYTFRWSGGTVGDSTSQGGFVVRSFFNQYRGPRGGQEVIVTVNDAEVMTSSLVSGLIIGAVQ